MPGPLEGIRIIEMGQLIAIPFSMKMLADMGAQVIRLESTGRLESYRSDSVYKNDISGDFWNKGANFYEQNRNKLGVTLDLGKPEGLGIIKELIAVADVFSENFTPRVIKNFGLEYEDVKKIKPDIIMVSSTGYGFYGPWSHFGATGPATEGAAGLAYQTGYAGSNDPVMSEIPYTDYTSGEHTVFAVMAALMHRLRTGQGQFVDISQTQATSATIPEILMDYSANGRTSPRIGNQDTVMSPHGCYQCQGDDRWITIAVANDEEWRALCQVLGRDDWASDTRFKDSLSRWQHRDELDALIGPVTNSWVAHDLMTALQKAGVAGGVVMDSKDLLFDPHLVERNFYEVVSHHESTGIPPLPYAGRPWKLSKTPAVPGMAAPLMGEHNHMILGDLLGKSAEEMADLEEAGIIGYGPTTPRPVQRPPMEEQIRQGRMQRFETDFEEQVRNRFPA